MRQKGQSAIEYMLILGFAMLLIIPGIYLFYSESADTSFQITAERIEQIGLRIVDQVETVYPNPRGTKTTIDFNLPDNVVNIRVLNSSSSLTGTDLIFDMDVGGRTQTMVFASRYPLFIGSCTAPAALPATFLITGKKSMVVQSCGQNVSIYES